MNARRQAHRSRPANARPWRFVVLYHQLPSRPGRGSHWDLMFQQGDALRTWAVAEMPPATGAAIQGRLLPPHRLAYLDYEGAVSGDRGHVRRLDRGTLQWITDTPQRAVIRIAGQRLRGQLSFQRLSEADSSDDECEAWMIWLSEAEEWVIDASW